MEEKNVELPIPNIRVSDVKRMIDNIKQQVGEEDTELSFEFIMTAFFPTAWYNIQSELRRQYTLGYIAGYGAEEKI